MAKQDPKLEALRQQGTLNPRSGEVADKLFAEDSFFDPRDLVQVKYEMLRRVQTEGKSVTGAVAAFGFSRPSFYQAQSAFEQDGLAGLVPHKRGPRHAHKLTEEVLTFIRETRQKDPSVRPPELARLIHQGFGTTVHPRSIERAWLRDQKKTPLNGSNQRVVGADLVAHYEQLRRDATGVSPRCREGLGMALFRRRGMTAWMQAWSQCTDCGIPQTQSQSVTTAPVPMDVRAQVATLLAGIILGLQQQEATS